MTRLEQLAMKVTKRIKRDAMQLFRLCLRSGVLDDDCVRQVTQYVAQASRRGRFALLWQVRRLVKLYLARHTATIESAAPLPSELQAAVQANLARLYGPGLSISFTQIPALIGGMRIRVGSDVYDGSVLGELTELESRLSPSGANGTKGGIRALGSPVGTRPL